MKNLKNCLTKPTRESRPWAVWIWNLALSKADLDSQMSSFAHSGFGGVAIRPSREMTPAFMSEEFIELFGMVLETARENDMGVRLVVDLSEPWTTGLEGALLRNRDLRAHTLVLEHTESVGGKSTFEREIDDPESMYLLAAKVKGSVLSLSESRQLKVAASKNTVSWRPPAGKWRAMQFRVKEHEHPVGGITPNPYNARTAHAYAQNVLEVLRKRYAKFVGNTFEGTVVEMSSLKPGANAIPWDDDLITKYRAKYKKDLLGLLPAVFSEVLAKEKKNRSHLYEYLFQAMYERFAQTLESWSKKHHLSQWTLCAERGLSRIPNELRGPFGIPEEGLSSVGLQNDEGTDVEFSSLRAVGDINTNQYRRETVAVVGRNRQCAAGTLQSLKNEVDRLTLAGNSRILIDGFFANLDQRNYIKTPYNPFWYSHEWPAMNELCEYAARLSGATEGLHYNRPIAVLLPSTSILADYLPSNDEALRRGTYLFNKVVAELQERNVEFDVISESLVLSCSVRENGEFGTADRIRKGNYEMLIVPYARLIPKSVLVFIERLAVKKGKVLFIEEAPQGGLDEGTTSAFTQRMQKLLSPKRASVQTVPANQIGTTFDALEPCLKVMENDRPCTDVRAMRGLGDRYEVYMLHNSSAKDDHFVTVSMPHHRHIVAIDCAKGEVHEITSVHKQDDLSVLQLNFSPYQTYLLAASATKITPPQKNKSRKHEVNVYGTLQRNYRIVLKDQWHFTPVSLNSLPLASWNSRIGLSRESGGYSHFYESSFFVKEVPKKCLLVLNGLSRRIREFGGMETAVEITVNGNSIVRDMAGLVGGVQENACQGLVSGEEAPFLNNTAACDLRDIVNRGSNRIAIRTMGSLSHPEPVLYPPVIMGSFSVMRGSHGWVIDAKSQDTGYDSWTRHGYAYMSGVGIYKHVFEVPNSYDRLVLRFSEVSGVIEVTLNGNMVGTYDWQPLEMDVTKLCSSKRNELQVKVGNTIDNYLRMNGRASGLTGEVYVDVY